MSPARLIALLALAAAPASAETVEDAQIWLNATVIGTLPNSRIAYFVEVQPRISGRENKLQQLLLRPALGYKFSDAVTVYGGYARVISPREGVPDRQEDRVFGQVTWTLPKLGTGTLSSRTRLEHRTFHGARDTGWRLREFVRYVQPIRDSKQVRALVSVEAFAAFNDTDWGAHAGFDQVRAFAGLELPLPGRSTVEAGYLNQTINDLGGRIRMNHVASLAVFIRP